MTVPRSSGPGALVALLRAWRVVGEDPVRVLGLSAVVLLLEIASVVVAVALLRQGASWGSVGLVLVGRAVLIGPLRASLLAFGAHTAGLAPRGPLVGGLVGLVLELVTVGLVVPVALLATLPFGGLGLAVGAQGLLPGAVAALALALVAAWLGSVAVRAAVAPFLARAVLGAEVDATYGFAVRLVLLGDALRILGALALAAGALPAYPLPLLAWLARLPRPVRSAA